jgi:hypothetical protein
MLGADIRIRIRRRVIRIRISEACMRAVIRVTAKQDTPKANNPFYHLFKIIACSRCSHSNLARKCV